MELLYNCKRKSDDKRNERIMTTMEDMFIFIAPVVILVLLIVYQFIKESETNKKLRFYEDSIEDLNKRVFTLEKQLKQTDTDSEILDKDRIEKIVSAKLNQALNSVLHSLQGAKESMDSFQSDINQRIDSPEDRIKEVSNIPNSSSSASDEKRVIALYKNGMMVDDIARELGIGIGQVDLMLKVHNLK